MEKAILIVLCIFGISLEFLDIISRLIKSSKNEEKTEKFKETTKKGKEFDENDKKIIRCSHIIALWFSMIAIVAAITPDFSIKAIPLILVSFLGMLLHTARYFFMQPPGEKNIAQNSTSENSPLQKQNHP